MAESNEMLFFQRFSHHRLVKDRLITSEDCCQDQKDSSTLSILKSLNYIDHSDMCKSNVKVKDKRNEFFVANNTMAQRELEIFFGIGLIIVL